MKHFSPDQAPAVPVKPVPVLEILKKVQEKGIDQKEFLDVAFFLSQREKDNIKPKSITEGGDYLERVYQKTLDNWEELRDKSLKEKTTDTNKEINDLHLHQTISLNATPEQLDQFTKEFLHRKRRNEHLDNPN